MKDDVLMRDERQDAVRRWLQEAAALAEAYSREVQGDDAEANQSDVTTIHLAASTLWRTSGGDPCWSKFDPDAFRGDLERNGLPTAVIETMLLTVYTLYCYLAAHGLLAPPLALAAQDRIVPHVRDCVRRLAEDHPAIADHPILEERGAWSPAAPRFGATAALLN